MRLASPSPVLSSVGTEPYGSSSPLPGVPDSSSPIAADKLFVRRQSNHPAKEQALAVLYSYREGGSDSEYSLHASKTRILSSATQKNRTQSDDACELVLREPRHDLDVVIEISDGLHVLYDYGPPGSDEGVYLGHRRTRMRQGIGYALTDGKLVWFGRAAAFWYHIVESGYASTSPLPPWRRRNSSGDPAAAELLLAHETKTPVDSPLPSNASSPSPLFDDPLSDQLDLSPALSECTQPVSPRRLPPPSPLRQRSKPAEKDDAEGAYLPQPPKFVYAPSRVVLMGDALARWCNVGDAECATVPRYPYDPQGLDGIAGTITQMTLPTQPDANEISSSLGAASDYSQAFLSPVNTKKAPSAAEREVVMMSMTPSTPASASTTATSLRNKYARQTPLALKSSSARNSLGSTPLSLTRRMPMPPPLVLNARGSSSAGAGPSSSRDEFPDEALMPIPLLTQSAGRLRQTQATTTPSSAQHQRQQVWPGLLESPLAQTSSSRRRAKTASVGVVETQETCVSPSSPVLPQPSMLLASRSADTTTTTSNGPDQSSERLAQALFDPDVDPLSSPPASTPTSNSDNANSATIATRNTSAKKPAPKQQQPSRSLRRGRGRRAGSNNSGSDKSLRESLRKLPGNKGPGRAGLSSRRSSAAGTPAPSTSSMATKKPTKKPRSETAPKLHSSTDTNKLETVTMSGFSGEDRDKAAREIEARGLRVTENPLTADICIRHGRLGRTFKVLCAMARGIPIVADSWAHQLPQGHLPDNYTDSHLVCDPATEREWQMVLSETLGRARESVGKTGSMTRLLSLYCVLITDDVARPDPVCLAVMVRAAGGHVLNDYGMREQRLLEEGESSMHWVLHVSRRLTDTSPQEQQHNPATVSSGWKPMSIDSAMHQELMDGLSASSSEPDDDNDEDWKIEHDRTRVATRSSSNKRRQKKLKSEPSMVFAPPPTGPTTPLLLRNNSEESSVGKRRRIDKSPSICNGPSAAIEGSNQQPTSSSFLDPNCSLNDMKELLAARKAELNIPANTQLLVVSAAPADSQKQKNVVRKAWERHGATVVEPELIIQSIIHCDRQF